MSENEMTVYELSPAFTTSPLDIIELGQVDGVERSIPLGTLLFEEIEDLKRRLGVDLPFDPVQEDITISFGFTLFLSDIQGRNIKYYIEPSGTTSLNTINLTSEDIGTVFRSRLVCEADTDSNPIGAKVEFWINSEGATGRTYNFGVMGWQPDDGGAQTMTLLDGVYEIIDRGDGVPILLKLS